MTNKGTLVFSKELFYDIILLDKNLSILSELYSKFDSIDRIESNFSFLWITGSSDLFKEQNGEYEAIMKTDISGKHHVLEFRYLRKNSN